MNRPGAGEGRDALAARLRRIREESGDGDGRAMAGRLGLPHRSWLRSSGA